jgi:hypothetical protein
MGLLKAAGLSAILVAAVACDPGVVLAPVDWEKVDSFRWRKEVDGVTLEIGDIGGLIGSASISPQLRVTNRTSDKFVLEGASLTTNGIAHEAFQSGKPDEKWRSAQPHSQARITIWWSFQRPLYTVLGSDAVVTLKCRLGDRLRLVHVQFHKS